MCLKKKKKKYSVVLLALKIFLVDTCPILGPHVPYFEFLFISPLGFKARVGSALFAFAEVNVMYIPC